MVAVRAVARKDVSGEDVTERQLQEHPNSTTMGIRAAR
jgi:hypothetical protein